MKKTRYQAVSPDGFIIQHDKPFYPSVEKAEEALSAWVKRYENQGFYSSPRFGRIPMDEILEYCKILPR
jgi:hypothetical protein